MEEEDLLWIRPGLAVLARDDADQIIGNIRDLFALDAVERIELAASATEVFQEFQERQNNEHVCVAALRKVHEMDITATIPQSRIIDGEIRDHVELIRQSMDMCSNHQDLQMKALYALRPLAVRDGHLPATVVPSILAAMQNFMHMLEIQMAAVGLLSLAEVHDERVVTLMELSMEHHTNAVPLVGDDLEQRRVRLYIETCFDALIEIYHSVANRRALRVIVDFVENQGYVELSSSASFWLEQARSLESRNQD